MEDFGVAREVSLLVVTVFVIGFGVGKSFGETLDSTATLLILDRPHGFCSTI
jgi:hypothetical protein